MKKQLIIFSLLMMIYIILIGNNVVFASYATGKCDKAVCNGAALNSSATLVSKSSTEHGYKATCSNCGAVYWGNVSSHNFGGWYKYSDSTHRRNCQNCGYKSATENHSGGTATCTEQAKCSKCYTLYGEVDSNNHDYSVACSTCGTANVVCSRCGAVKSHTCDTASNTAPTSYTTITATKTQVTHTYVITANGTYYYWVKDAAGNINSKSITVSVAKNYQNGTNYYSTLAAAVSGASAGNTITVYATGFTDSSAVTVDKNLTLNMNGKIVTREAQITVNSGITFSITGAGTYYAWGKDGLGNQVYQQFTVAKKQLKAVIDSTTLTYNGQVQVPTVTVETGVTGETAIITVTGNGTSINVGDYTANAEITSVTGGQGKTSNYELIK